MVKVCPLIYREKKLFEHTHWASKVIQSWATETPTMKWQRKLYRDTGTHLIISSQPFWTFLGIHSNFTPRKQAHILIYKRYTFEHFTSKIEKKIREKTKKAHIKKNYDCEHVMMKKKTARIFLLRVPVDWSTRMYTNEMTRGAKMKCQAYCRPCVFHCCNYNICFANLIQL